MAVLINNALVELGKRLNREDVEQSFVELFVSHIENTLGFLGYTTNICDTSSAFCQAVTGNEYDSVMIDKRIELVFNDSDVHRAIYYINKERVLAIAKQCDYSLYETFIIILKED